MPDLLLLARPRHWIKNAFVLMPVPFAVAAGATLRPGLLLLGLAAQCLVSSGIYVCNDVLDVEHDRRHPTKAQRPVAAGRVGLTSARLLGLCLLLAGMTLGWMTGVLDVVSVLAAYILLNLTYSVAGRQVPLLDVFLLSTGYVLRVILGCVLVGAPPSHWLLLCTSALALFLALAKRRADLVAGVDGEHRPSLAGYDRGFLDQALAITSAMAVIAYALYCIEAEVLVPGREFATLPFVVFGVLEYLRRVHVKDEGAMPVDLVLGSPVLLACGAGWIATALWSVGLP